MWMDVSPLVRNRDFRFLYVGQFVSRFGSMMTYVALPYQVFRLTKSSFAVGMIGVVQLVPLLATALVGGALADAMDRRKLLIFSELILALCSVVYALNSMSAHSRLWLVFLLAATASAVNGFHRPALDAMTPRLVPAEDIPATSALNAFKSTTAAVAGPALCGIIMASFGLAAAYFADAASFAISLVALAMIHKMPPSEKARKPGLESIFEGMKYAKSRQEIIGTYAVDFMAMVFGMPYALFPAVAQSFGGAVGSAKVIGWLYSAPEVGAFICNLTSAWTKKITRHGAAVVLAALVWGAAIVAFGVFCYSWRNLWLALFFLALAGAGDMVSVIFRFTLWNGTIPDHLRGRLAGLEMVSYMSGPLLGNAESGLVAALAGTQFSIVSGGLLCIGGILACIRWLPRLWSYDFEPVPARLSPVPERQPEVR